MRQCDSDLSLENYSCLMNSFLSSGYKFTDYENINPAEKNIISRHDIDFSMGAALKMALLERDIGIKSTYFLLLKSDFYNLHSSSSSNIIKAIINCGHNIGLHFDASIYKDDKCSIDDAVQKECDILSSIVERSIDIVSFHRPTKQLIGYPDKVGGRIHTYQPYYFYDIGYCSDSRGEWHYGSPLDHKSYKNGTAIQLLTHPIWWVFNGTPKGKLEQFISNNKDQIVSLIKQNSSVY